MTIGAKRGRPITRTPKSWINKLVTIKSAGKLGLVRRKLADIPSHMSLEEIYEEASSRGYMVLTNHKHIVILLDRYLSIRL